MPELSEGTKQLIAKYANWQRSLKPKEGASTVHVDEVASKVASFYEQIRTIIDWKEEHLMRRAAIIRKLKRRFLDLELNNFSVDSMAENLVMELIRGGYFSNDRIEETKIADVKKILEKHVFILAHNPESKKGKAGLQFYNWLLEVCACEVEETLAPSLKEMALIDYMFLQMQERVKVSDAIYEKGTLKKEDTDILLYIAVQQALFKLDNPIISYNLITYKYPYWKNPTEEELLKISQNMYKIWRGIEKDLAHPLSNKFYTICEKYDTPYLLLGDVLTYNDLAEVSVAIHEPALFEGFIRKAYDKRLKDLKDRMSRAAMYSTASIFFSKILILLVVELILARLLQGHLSIASILVDVLIPTGLMILLVLTARMPSKKNFSLVLMESMKMAYQKDTVDLHEIKAAKQRGVMTRAILALIYLAGACISFGGIYFVFTYFKFPITSIVINIIFIALILFAGTAIRRRSRELTIENDSSGFLEFISDVLLLPITGMGRLLSNTWKQYNAITAFFNALIDMPFSAFVEFLERWRYFIKDKKEEMR